MLLSILPPWREDKERVGMSGEGHRCMWPFMMVLPAVPLAYWIRASDTHSLGSKPSSYEDKEVSVMTLQFVCVLYVSVML